MANHDEEPALDLQHGTSSYRYRCRSLQPQRRASETWGALAPVGRKYDCLERHPTWIAAECLTQSLRQDVDDSIRIDAAARLYLVNQRVAVDQPTRKARSVWNFFFQPNDGDTDVSESRVDQGFLDGIDLVIGERYHVKLRRISREETCNGLMCYSAEWVVPV